MNIDVLIVDDEQDIRDLVSGILIDNGYSVYTAAGYMEALDEISKKEPNVIILDVWLGNSAKDGIALLNTIKDSHSHVPVIMMSGHSTIETAVEAIKQGAYDFIEKPFDATRLLISVEKALENAKLRQENEVLRTKARISEVIIGESAFVKHLKTTIDKLSNSSSRCLIKGPLGSDKEGIAKNIHDNSPNCDASFIPINCQTYNQNQLDVDLFGADVRNEDVVSIKSGAFERAGDGTVYFEEITALGPDLQQKILKTIKNTSFCRIGGQVNIPLKCRILCSSSVDVEEAIKNDQFSSELYYRLSANIIDIVPLAKRANDIPHLVKYFINQTVQAYNTKIKEFTEQAMLVLISYDWPGDVAQLRNLIDWIFYNTDYNKTLIDIDDLPSYLVEKDGKTTSGSTQFVTSISNLSVKEAREKFEREYFVTQLKKFGGSVTKTAKFVGMERSALHRKLKMLGIQSKFDV